MSMKERIMRVIVAGLYVSVGVTLITLGFSLSITQGVSLWAGIIYVLTANHIMRDPPY